MFLGRVFTIQGAQTHFLCLFLLYILKYNHWQYSHKNKLSVVFAMLSVDKLLKCMQWTMIADLLCMQNIDFLGNGICQ